MLIFCHNLNHMSDMAGNLQERLTVNLWRAPVFTPSFGGVRVAHICFLFLCVCVCVYLCPVSSVSNVTSASELSILDCPFVFL